MLSNIKFDKKGIRMAAVELFEIKNGRLITLEK